MKYLAPLLGVVAVLTVATTGVSAQALDAATGRQAVFDLANEVRSSSALYLVGLHGPQGRDVCQPFDPTELAQAEADLNAYDQRATSLANATSGVIHTQAMALVRSIESSYLSLAYPVMPDMCYVA